MALQLNTANKSKSMVPLLYAIVGSFFAILGAFVEEIIQGSPLILFVVGPLIEEIFKPMGVIVLLESKPSYIKSKTQIFWLCVVAAVIFAFLENLVYIWWYVANALTIKLIAFRYTVCVVVHALSTSILSLGLIKEFDRAQKENEKFELENTLPYIVGAVGFHGAYNFVVYLLTTSKFLTF